MVRDYTLLFTTIVIGLQQLIKEHNWELTPKEISKFAETIHGYLSSDKKGISRSPEEWIHIFHAAADWCWGKNGCEDVTAQQILTFTHVLEFE